MKIEWFYGWRWYKKAVGFGLGFDVEIYKDDIEITVNIGPLYFGFEIYGKWI